MIRLRLVVAVVLLTFFIFSTTFQSPCSRKRHGFIILPLTLEKRVRASRCSAYLVRFPKINTFCDGKRKLVIFSKVPIDQRSMWIIVCAISGLAYLCCSSACPNGLITRCTSARPHLKDVLRSISCRLNKWSLQCRCLYIVHVWTDHGRRVQVVVLQPLFYMSLLHII